MPNRKEHVQAGTVIGLIGGLTINLFRQHNKVKSGEREKFDILEAALWTLGGAGIGAIGGALPDILEPATSPHHRKFFHSATFGSLSTAGMFKLMMNNEVPEEVKDAALSAYLGYMSHLVLDSETPFGLPIV